MSVVWAVTRLAKLSVAMRSAAQDQFSRELNALSVQGKLTADRKAHESTPFRKTQSVSRRVD